MLISKLMVMGNFLQGSYLLITVMSDQMDAGNSTGPFGGSLKVTPINWVGGSVQLDLISFVSDQFVFRHFSDFQIYV